MNFPLLPGAISDLFLERGITNFRDAADFIRHVPYGRNSSRTDFTLVFRENCGTCSMKHALLAQLAMENHIPGVQLVTGIYRMSRKNTPRIGNVLENAGLAYIPEAHCYLRVHGELLDCMSPGEPQFAGDLLEEIEITPEQVGAFKVNYHQEFLKRWLAENPGIKLSFAEVWALREACIRQLSI